MLAHVCTRALSALAVLATWAVLSLAIFGAIGGLTYMIERSSLRQPPTSQWSPAGSASASVHIEAKRGR